MTKISIICLEIINKAEVNKKFVCFTCKTTLYFIVNMCYYIFIRGLVAVPLVKILHWVFFDLSLIHTNILDVSFRRKHFIVPFMNLTVIISDTWTFYCMQTFRKLIIQNVLKQL